MRSVNQTMMVTKMPKISRKVLGIDGGSPFYHDYSSSIFLQNVLKLQKFKSGCNQIENFWIPNMMFFADFLKPHDLRGLY